MTKCELPPGRLRCNSLYRNHLPFLQKEVQGQNYKQQSTQFKPKLALNSDDRNWLCWTYLKLRGLQLSLAIMEMGKCSVVIQLFNGNFSAFTWASLFHAFSMEDNKTIANFWCTTIYIYMYIYAANVKDAFSHVTTFGYCLHDGIYM